MITAIVGLGWGDEGKGKMSHIESANHAIVVRYNGGANAGHTVRIGGQTFKLHHIPAGAVAANCPELVLTHGMVINPVSLVDEIKQLQQSGIDITSRLHISSQAHCVMPWHIAADIKNGGTIGTTKQGIGPCYADKMHRRNAIRVKELITKLNDEKTKRFFAVDAALHGNSTLWEKYRAAAQFLSEFDLICDTGEFLRRRVKEKSNILFESANGIHLDVDFGTYPYCTSSGVGPAAIPQACGLPNLHIDRIIGVIKCYATRVGEGPFPSEIISAEAEDRYRSSSRREWYKYTNDPYPEQHDVDMSHLIREKGHEYGTTTGRPRRIGWFDVDMTRLGIELTGATEIALMHADTIGHVESPKMLLDGKLVNIQHKLSSPVAGSVEWSQFTKHLSLLLSRPITYISTGPASDDIIRGPYGTIVP